MSTKTKKTVAYDYIRIPVTLKDNEDKRLALAVKQAVEKREGRTQSWAIVVRLALRALAAVEGVKCK
jgi:hypothetical protein